MGAQRYFAKSMQLNANQPELQQALARVDVPNPLDAIPGSGAIAPTPQMPQVPQPLNAIDPSIEEPPSL